MEILWQAWGWSLLLKQKKKTLAYCTPQKGYFQLVVVPGKEGREAIEKLPLSDDVREAVLASAGNTQGRTADLDVKTEADVEMMKVLLQMKA